MMVLPEVQIEKLLVAGLAVVKADPSILNDLFANYDAAFIAEAITYFTARDIPVRLNWPREGVKIPSVNIVNAGDSEDAAKDALGDFLHELEQLEGDTTNIEYAGIAKRGTYQILCLAPDPREALYVQLVVESLLILNKMDMQGVGMHEITLSSSDLRFEESLSPEFTNSRLVTLTCLHYHAVPVVEQLLNLCSVTVRVSNVGPFPEVEE